MRNRMKKTIIIFALIAILISACSSGASSSTPALTRVPQVVEATATASLPTATAIVTATPQPTSSAPVPTATATPEVMYYPTVTFSADVACFMGPDKNYYRVANFSIGQSTQVQGHSDDAKWLNVLTVPPSKLFTCWVPLSSVEHFASANALQVVKAVPLPTGATLVVAREKKVCGVDKDNGVVLDWTPAADATGFIIYRNGEIVSTVYGGEYTDHKTPVSQYPYLLTYTIQAINSVGISNFTAVTSVSICD